MEDELLLFEAPPFHHGLFVYRVVPEDAEELIATLKSFGLLYRCAFLQSSPTTLHAWYYSRNTCLKAFEVTQGAVTVGARTYRLHRAREEESRRRVLRLEQMYDLCNFYFGFDAWNTEVVSVTEQFRDQEARGKETVFVSRPRRSDAQVPLSDGHAGHLPALRRRRHGARALQVPREEPPQRVPERKEAVDDVRREGRVRQARDRHSC